MAPTVRVNSGFGLLSTVVGKPTMKVSDFLVMSVKSHARGCQTIISFKTDRCAYSRRIKFPWRCAPRTRGANGRAPQIFDGFAGNSHGDH